MCLDSSIRLPILILLVNTWRHWPRGSWSIHPDLQEQARKEKEELERVLEENRRKVEEAQRREALEQQRREEERYRELEELQRQKEEALRRKKQEEEQERKNQMKLLGKNKSRPKLSFALGSKWALTNFVCTIAEIGVISAEFLIYVSFE